MPRCGFPEENTAFFLMSVGTDFRGIPVFIISYNRALYLAKLVAWLEKAGYKNIHIVDNGSTYPPLLEYLQQSRHQVHRMDRNYGHLVVWDCHQFDSIVSKQVYVVSDCDILPDEACPSDAVAYFYDVLQQRSQYTKVGFSLKVDDLPECYLFRDKVINWEKQFWAKQIGNGLFEANIDTTFALYRPGIFPNDSRWWASVRTGAPYAARHLPWYLDSNNLSDEERCYQRDLKAMSTFWSVTDALALKEQNLKLRNEILWLRSQANHLRTHYWHLSKNRRELLASVLRRIGRQFRRNRE